MAQRRAARRIARSAARLAAVQGLYQIDLAGTDADGVLQELDSRSDEESMVGDAKAERELIESLVRDAAGRLAEIDGIIGQSLSNRWRIERLAYVLRAILRVAVSELQTCPGTPARVVITEYLDIAHAFFDDTEVGMVNGVLDSVAHSLRPGELKPRSEAPQ